MAIDAAHRRAQAQQYRDLANQEPDQIKAQALRQLAHALDEDATHISADAAYANRLSGRD
jgi:hypothetical protein